MFMSNGLKVTVKWIKEIITGNTKKEYACNVEKSFLQEKIKKQNFAVKLVIGKA